MRSQTSFAETPLSSNIAAIGSTPPNRSLSLSMHMGMSPQISSLARSMWSFPVILSISSSRVWENGGWQMSCRNPAALMVLVSSASSSRASHILPARSYTPRECSKRVWLAPGNTMLPRPSCLMECSLCISCLPIMSMNMPSITMLPWIGSWTYFLLLPFILSDLLQ